MKIENGILFIEPHDFDHIMGWSESNIPQLQFKEGLEIELEMHGLESESYQQIMLLIK